MMGGRELRAQLILSGTHQEVFYGIEISIKRGLEQIVGVSSDLTPIEVGDEIVEL